MSNDLLPPLPEPHLDVMRPGTKWYTADQMRAYALAAMAQPAVSGKPFRPDWSLLEATQESLREHMAEVQRLRAAAQQGLDALYRWHMTDGETADLMPAFEALRAALTQPAASGEPADQLSLLQAGFNNAELLAHWRKKLPGVEPTDRELSAFAVGTEVGWQRARDLERQDWSRVHHVLKKHGIHPGRTDDLLADVIDRALTATAQPAPAPECDSPKLCAVNGACAGQYGTKKQCATAQPAPARVPLTDEQIDRITAEQWGRGLGAPYAAYRAYARAVEAAHGIAAPGAPDAQNKGAA